MMTGNPLAQLYTPHQTIIITSNDDFISQGFIGAGRLENPYLIQHLNITANSGNLIRISNTTVHFRISEIYLNGLGMATAGISLSGVRHGSIINNTIMNTIDGIRGNNVSSSFFLNNSVYLNSRFGFYLEESSSCVLDDNSIHDNQINGVHLKNTDNTTVLGNWIYNHDFLNVQSAILLDNTSYIQIENNLVFNNYIGMNLLNSADNNRIANNSVKDNLHNAIRLEYASRNTIVYNVIKANLEYGILLTTGSNENTIRFNSFEESNLGETQASDDGTDNLISGNYWDDWFSLDANEDLIVDIPYPIDGISNNSDPYPLIIFSKSAIRNIGNKPTNFDLQILLLSSIIVLSVSVGIYLYLTRVKKQDFEAEEPFTNYIVSEQIDEIKPLYHKIVVGLENIQQTTLPETTITPLLKAEEPVTLIEILPPEIKDDLIHGLKWRTIQTLIEIAFQAPTETNVVRLAQYLTIPRSTLSKEIKTLTNLHYIESFVSTKTLRDARYKNYKITPKGYKLLFTLKEAFRIALDRLREKEGAING
jgi:parallel beta-helix repeat protein